MVRGISVFLRLDIYECVVKSKVMDEQAFTQGHRRAWLSMLREGIRQIGSGDTSVARLVSEREAAIQTLRQVCEDHGNNDWPDDLHLSDIIDKHLWRYL